MLLVNIHDLDLGGQNFSRFLSLHHESSIVTFLDLSLHRTDLMSQSLIGSHCNPVKCTSKYNCIIS